MLPADPSNPHRLPAPTPSAAMSKVGWITAFVGMLLAAYFYFQQMTLAAQVKLERNSTEMAQVEIKSLKNQLFAERILAERQIASLTNNAPKTETLVFAHLTPPEAGSLGPTALVTWLPARQAGLLFAEQLPTTRDDEELRLWLEEKNSGPVSAGVITPGPGRSTKVEFKSAKPLGLAVRFTVTRERKDNTGAPTGPTLMSGAPQ
ncbi:MAG: anti-sigma factor [Nibricoccus sp.]